MSDTKQGRLSDKAEQALLQQIHSGELPVGAKLPSEPILAKEMGLSRGILREALNSLQAKGYISRTPRGGSYVMRTADNHSLGAVRSTSIYLQENGSEGTVQQIDLSV